jgi:hypothetical protein
MTCPTVFEAHHRSPRFNPDKPEPALLRGGSTGSAKTHKEQWPFRDINEPSKPNLTGQRRIATCLSVQRGRGLAR